MNNVLHYKDYEGSVEFSGEDGAFHGKVSGIKDLISFEGESAADLTADFHNAIDDYLAFCMESGKSPERQFKGSFNVRVGSDLHRKAALIAQRRGESLNTFVEGAIRTAVA